MPTSLATIVDKLVGICQQPVGATKTPCITARSDVMQGVGGWREFGLGEAAGCNPPHGTRAATMGRGGEGEMAGCGGALTSSSRTAG